VAGGETGARAERRAFRLSFAGLLTTMALASLDQNIVSIWATIIFVFGLVYRAVALGCLRGIAAAERRNGSASSVLGGEPCAELLLCRKRP
jgi:hypothetical protein